MFDEWEEDRGGFKIKWSDDVSCWIVFADAGVGECKGVLLFAFVAGLPRRGEGADDMWMGVRER